MNGDGGDPQPLISQARLRLLGPAWSADGQRIAFVSNRDGNFEIYVTNADGHGGDARDEQRRRRRRAVVVAGRQADRVRERRATPASGRSTSMNADGSGVIRLTTTSSTTRRRRGRPTAPRSSSRAARTTARTTLGHAGRRWDRRPADQFRRATRRIRTGRRTARGSSSSATRRSSSWAPQAAARRPWPVRAVSGRRGRPTARRSSTTACPSSSRRIADGNGEQRSRVPAPRRSSPRTPNWQPIPRPVTPPPPAAAEAGLRMPTATA